MPEVEKTRFLTPCNFVKPKCKVLFLSIKDRTPRPPII